MDALRIKSSIDFFPTSTRTENCNQWAFFEGLAGECRSAICPVGTEEEEEEDFGKSDEGDSDWPCSTLYSAPRESNKCSHGRSIKALNNSGTRTR